MKKMTIKRISNFRNSEICLPLEKDLLSGEEVVAGFKSHSLNSSGVVRFPQHGMDYVRVGLSLLGSELSRAGLALRPAVFFRTVVNSNPNRTCWSRCRVWIC